MMTLTPNEIGTLVHTSGTGGDFQIGKRKRVQNFRTAGGNSKPYGCVESIKRELPAGSITRGGDCDEL